MKKALATLLALTGIALAQAPAPYPITINSYSRTAPQIDDARASDRTFRVTFKDGVTATDITGYTPFMSWSTNDTAATITTASVSVVTATNGIVDFTLTDTDLNYAAGRYLYEVGLSTSTTQTVSQQGVLIIRGSPYGVGATPTTWTTNVNWGLYTFAGGASGPAIGDGSTITWTTNASGQIVFVSSASVVSNFIENLFTQDGGILVGTGAGAYQEEAPATARASLGLTIGTDVLAPDGDGGGLSGVVLDTGDTMTGDLDMSANDITSVSVIGFVRDAHTAAANISAAGDLLLSASGGVVIEPDDEKLKVSANIDMTGHSISNLAENSITFTNGATISSAKIGYWDDAYGWGDHGTKGYLTSYAETDLIWGASSNAVLSHIGEAVETAHDVSNVTTGDLSSIDWGSLGGGGGGIVNTVLTTTASSTWDAGTGTLTIDTSDDGGSGGGSSAVNINFGDWVWRPGETLTGTAGGAPRLYAFEGSGECVMTLQHIKEGATLNGGEYWCSFACPTTGAATISYNYGVASGSATEMTNASYAAWELRVYDGVIEIASNALSNIGTANTNLTGTLAFTNTSELITLQLGMYSQLTNGPFVGPVIVEW